VSAAFKADDGYFTRFSRQEAEEALIRYRKFLRLVRLHPHEPLAPSRDIDEMWHLHMLHPVDYQNDCITNFGGIMDHDGGFGAASEEEWRQLLELFEHTAKLWKEHFAEEYAAGARNCRRRCARCAIRCRTACKK
jgi:hypothetical protein